MKIRIVHMLRIDWLLGVRIKTSSVSVLGTYINKFVELNIIFII